jgi:hypothetical protein
MAVYDFGAFIFRRYDIAFLFVIKTVSGDVSPLSVF